MLTKNRTRETTEENTHHLMLVYVYVITPMPLQDVALSAWVCFSTLLSGCRGSDRTILVQDRSCPCRRAKLMNDPQCEALLSLSGSINV